VDHTSDTSIEPIKVEIEESISFSNEDPVDPKASAYKGSKAGIVGSLS
jgi:hypothetical protein